MSVIERLLRRDDDGALLSLGGLVIEPMHRRDLRRGVMAIESVSYPRPWSQGVFDSELAQVRAGTRRYLVARRIDGTGRGRRQVVGYAGLWFSGDEAHVTNVAVEPAQQRTGVATALLVALADAAIERGCSSVDARGAGVVGGSPGVVPALRLQPGGCSGPVLREHRGCDRHVVQRHPRRRLPRTARFDPRRDRATVDPMTAQVPDDEAVDAPGTPRTFDASTLVLGIETSCDETAAALVLGGYDVVSSVVSTQVDLHADFGGVVPEIASRAHLDVLNPVIARTIVEAGVDEERIDAVACTVGPGLIGALLVGVSAAKALAMAWDVPFVAVNHLEAHLYAASLEDPTLEFPLVVLLVSGGHTMLVEMQDHGRYRLVGQTIDDAAGEAFDKVARFLGLGYPGGPAIDRAALDGDPEAIAVPSGDHGRGVRLQLQRAEDGGRQPRPQASRRVDRRRRGVVPGGGRRRARHKARRAAAEVGATGLVLGGGVAANSLLREQILDACERGRDPRVPAEPGDVHRQRGDDRGGRLAPAPPRRADPARRRRLPNLRLPCI